MGQDPIVIQSFILLILRSQYFKPEKAGRFRAGCKRGLWGDLCGLHPARKRSNGGLGGIGRLPPINQTASTCGGISALLLSFFFLRSRCECEANPAGGSPERATGRQSRFYRRAVAEPAGEPNKGRRLDWPRFYQSGTGQG
jgi:hypothetical protein